MGAYLLDVVHADFDAITAQVPPPLPSQPPPPPPCRSVPDNHFSTICAFVGTFCPLCLLHFFICGCGACFCFAVSVHFVAGARTRRVVNTWRVRVGVGGQGGGW